MCSFLQNVAEAFRELVMTLDPLTLRARISGKAAKKFCCAEGSHEHSGLHPEVQDKLNSYHTFFVVCVCVFSFVEAGTERLIVIEEKPDVIK